MTVFISARELVDDLRNGRRQTVLASLWAPREGDAAALYQSNHIPTALFCDPAVSLAGMPGSRQGRNPLPTAGQLQEWFRKWGLEHDRPVVIYDEGSGVFAARAWWTLRWAGVQDVKILDGGRAAWERLGFPTVGGPGNIVVHSDVEVQPNSIPAASIDQVKEFTGTLIDARNESRYAGRREILDLRAGHIPGALNVPVSDLFNKDMTVRSADVIRDRLAQAGITHNTDPASAIVYSGSGNHSALLLAAMEHAGLPIITHCIGGWSQWSADKKNKVASHV